MAKKPRQAKAEHAVAPLDQVAENIGESLGNFLNRIESQWHLVRGQRDSVVRSLLAIRDKANALLAETGDIELRVPEMFKRRGKSKGSKAKKTRAKKGAKSRAASKAAKKSGTTE